MAKVVGVADLFRFVGVLRIKLGDFLGEPRTLAVEARVSSLSGEGEEQHPPELRREEEGLTFVSKWRKLIK